MDANGTSNPDAARTLIMPHRHSQSPLEGARLWQVTLGDACFRIYVNSDKVVGAAPIGRWMLGKSWSQKVKPWLQAKDAHGQPVNQ